MKEGFNEDSLRKFLEDKGHKNLEMHSVQPNIEDCFLHLMKQ
jgi:hypothetical protein